MIRKRRKFKKFCLDAPDEVQEYEDLLNDKLVMITEREKVVETEKHYEEGKLIRTEDTMYYLVHWEEQII